MLVRTHSFQTGYPRLCSECLGDKVTKDPSGFVGHWEADTVEGQNGTVILVTEVERVSSYMVLAQIPNKEVETLNKAAVSSLKALPLKVRKKLTVDNGKEFSQHQQLEKAIRMTIYFADPYSSWQRGLHENTNGFLRQYFPK